MTSRISHTGNVFCLALIGLLSAESAFAALNLPNLFTDHMVVQRNQPVAVWGRADAGERITVEFHGDEVETTASKHGDWLVHIPPHKAGGPFTMSIRGQTEQVTIEDILIGEVWLCSGQSNMEWPVNRTQSGDEAIENANKPKMRLFDVPREAAVEPQHDVDAAWRVCSSESVPKFSAVGYFFGSELHQKLDVPVGLIGSNWGGTRIEPWTPPKGFQAVPALSNLTRQVAAQEASPENVSAHRQTATHLYNGMIAPLVPFGLQGAIWYQGEANLGDGWTYHEKMKGLIRGWRQSWAQPDLGFYYVQLAPYDYGNADPKLLAEIWEAQAATLSEPRTGMAVTTDIGNLDDIHPRNKQDVGHRLALWALSQTYSRPDLTHSGPLYESMTIEDGRIRIHFNHVGDGLKTIDGQAPTEFRIAGSNHNFMSAKAQIDHDSVVVWSEKVDQPIAVRFAWHDRSQPNLVNQAGLPASPFRTDQW